MKSNAVSGILLGLVVFVLAVQLHHRAVCPVRAAGAADVTPSWSAPADPSGIVTIFGREFSESDVRGWFSLVDGKYCCRGAEILRVGEARGEPMTYELFVGALKRGIHFPELKGAGVISDGERVVLKHKPLGRPRGQTSARVHVQGAVPVGTTDSTLESSSRVGTSSQAR